MTDDYLVRAANAADIEPMRVIERRAAQKFREIGYDFCADGPIRDSAEHQRVLRTGATFVADRATGLAGFAMFEALDAEAHLIEIDVDPDHQGKGLARRLIAAGEAWARRNGFEAMTLTTYRDVAWNAPYYSRLGFSPFEPGPERVDLRKTIDQEIALGFGFAPRIAMRMRIEQ